MELIDSHSHIDFAEFDHDRTDAILRAKDADVSHIIVSSTIADRWQLITNIVEATPSICHAAYGLHPMFMDDVNNDDLDKLKQYLQEHKAVAIGEIGLDFFIPESHQQQNKQKQIDIFVGQLAIADEFQLPVIIHARKSLDIVLKHLRQFPSLTGSIHSFSGSEQQAKQLIDLGFYLGFGGPITYTRATRLQQLVKKLPLDNMLIETDSPDQPDSSHHQQRNEPAYLPTVANTIAEIRGIDINQVASVTTTNAKRLFAL
ncbi:TatD family hydrolase [Cocleimonas flava]|uniref:TatD DNase family protein n=1 Tax=Cocleimonas flava TaxID=634765 RepID=A0A4R1FDX2_9GAMM|nr:TatD family hydrolase [Cocleimonas flava]TCJ89051.1 TatD DNase family protein [Cocleimonas flava]